MERDTLRRLEMLNQLSLTEAQKEDVIAFFAARDGELKTLEAIDISETERMVPVMPIMTVVRDDVVVKAFEREDLQAGAPETDEGYWCVPKVVE